MKIRQLLKEAAGITAAFAFGRFNPAHQGHMAVWQTVERSGVKWYIGTNPSTLGPNDPLTFEQKSAWMEAIYPAIAGHIAPEQSVMTLAARIYKDLGNKEDATVAYITDETDWAWSGKLLNQYNGVEGKHGYYKFAQIVHVPSPRVSSATALRDAARADDRVAFYHASGTDPKLKVAGKTYFDTVKEACEKYPLPVKKAKKTESSLNEFAPNGFNGGDDGDEFSPEIAKMAQDDGFTKGVGLSDSATLERAITINHWHSQHGGMYKQFFVKGFIAGRKEKIRHDNRQYDLNLQLMKDGSIRHGEQDIAEGWKEKAAAAAMAGAIATGAGGVALNPARPIGPATASRPAPTVANPNPAAHPLNPLNPSSPNYVAKAKVITIHGKEYLRHELPNDLSKVEQTKDDKGNDVYVWIEKSGMRPQYTYRWFAPVGVKEASLATMRDYFAGDEQARDKTKLAQIRDYYDKHDANGKVDTKQFNSIASYIRWLEQNKKTKIGGAVNEDDEAGEVEKTGQLIPFPAGTSLVKVSDVYDWYKLGQVISDLDDADPEWFGQGAPETILAFGSEEEENKLMPLLQRLGLKIKDIDPENVSEAYHAEPLVEYLRKIHKRWAIVSKKEGKPLVYFKGEGKPSKEWVKKQERRINYFKHKK